MTTSTLPRTTAPSTADAPGERAPRTAPTTAFRRGPFAAATYREIGYALTSLPIAIGGFVLSVTLFSLGAGLSLTVLGLPVLAALLAAARGLGAAERRRAGALLGLDATAPKDIPAATRPGWWAGCPGPADGRGGLEGAALPGRHVPVAGGELLPDADLPDHRMDGRALPALRLGLSPVRGLVRVPGLRLHLGRRPPPVLPLLPLQIAAASLLGLVIVFLTPKLVHALTSVDRAAVRSLLGRNRPL